MNTSIKILIIGSARHGKDTVAEMIKKHFGYTFEGSSVAASRIFLYDALKEKYNYSSPEECFDDRINHRSEWYDLICEFNKNDRARLAKEIMKTSDIYVGMRDNEEFDECLRQGVFDLVIGVYDHRKPVEDKTSFNIDLWEKSDIIIPNCGSLKDLENKILKLSIPGNMKNMSQKEQEIFLVKELDKLHTREEKLRTLLAKVRGGKKVELITEERGDILYEIKEK